METLVLMLTFQFLLFAVIMVYGLLHFFGWAAALVQGDDGLAERARRREQEIHDSEHDIHLP